MRADDEEAAAANDEAQRGNERDGSRMLQAMRMTTISVEGTTYRLEPTWRLWSSPSFKISVSSETILSAAFLTKGKIRCNRSQSPDGIWSYLFCSFKS